MSVHPRRYPRQPARVRVGQEASVTALSSGTNDRTFSEPDVSVPRAREAIMAEVLPIETPTLGDRSYLVHDGEAAAVIDPQRDTDRITALAGRNGVRITHVAETHIHNDYVSGGLALSRATGAAYLVNGADPVRFDRQPVGDGDVIQVGAAIRLRVMATPGHTFSHLSYALEAAGEVAGVFTG